MDFGIEKTNARRYRMPRILERARAIEMIMRMSGFQTADCTDSLQCSSDVSDFFNLHQTLYLPCHQIEEIFRNITIYKSRWNSLKVGRKRPSFPFQFLSIRLISTIRSSGTKGTLLFFPMAVNENGIGV